MQTGTESTPERPSIIICDDTIEEIRVIVSVLKTADYKLIVAQNGKEACDRAALLRPSLILMDVRMPVMDGFAACRLLKAYEETRHIPVIFLTAANDLHDRLEGLRAGAVDYIVKPAHAEEVLLRVAAQIGRDQDRRTHRSNREPDDATVPPSSSAHQAIVQAFVRLLESNQDDTTDDIDLLAAKVGTNRQGLSEAFRHTVGSSVFGWLREQRLRRACQWLARTAMPITQIALELGYSSSGNFATAFRERYGITPREFRRLAQTDAQSIQPLWRPGSHDLPLSASPWALLDRALPMLE